MKYAERAHKVGAFVVVDSTFATPVLQNPLQLGADIVMHSCTKGLSGHSDVLGGALVTQNPAFHQQLRSQVTLLKCLLHLQMADRSSTLQRMLIGSLMGTMECWLLLRSLRTVTLRTKKQSRTAMKVALWLEKHPKVSKVWHPGVSSHPSYLL